MSDTEADTFGGRRRQMFPVLTDAEMAHIRRFGTPCRYPRAAVLFAAGQPGVGMFVVLRGVVAIRQRNGLGRGDPDRLSRRKAPRLFECPLERRVSQAPCLETSGKATGSRMDWTERSMSSFGQYT